MFKIGDYIHFKCGGLKFRCYIEEINNGGWIWAKDIPNPYQIHTYEKNFHNPKFCENITEKIRKRNRKIDKILNEK